MFDLHTSKHFSPRPSIGSLAIVFAGALVLTGCSSAAPRDTESHNSHDVGNDSLLREHGLTGMDARQIIDRLDAMPVAQRPAGLMAAVHPDSLVLSDGAGRQSVLPLPQEEFYVSVAPYSQQTHDCYFHSLTTCQGELANESLKVTVTEKSSGQVLIDDEERTFGNGFVGLWLPRGIEATLRIEHEGKTASQLISTANADDPTCLTTLRLS